MANFKRQNPKIIPNVCVNYSKAFAEYVLVDTKKKIYKLYVFLKLRNPLLRVCHLLGMQIKEMIVKHNNSFRIVTKRQPDYSKVKSVLFFFF